MKNLDPFLMLDDFSGTVYIHRLVFSFLEIIFDCDFCLVSVSPPAGFPDHPHRGFETVTYMLDVSIIWFLCCWILMNET